MLLFEGKNAEALAALKIAAEENPLPEYLWALADAQRTGGVEEEARKTEQTLERRGAADDPRTFSLYLSTRAGQAGGEKATLARRLAEAELATRGDIFTHDAVAWAALAEGKVPEARKEIAAARSRKGLRMRACCCTPG